jgi:hypothetical protein
MNNWDTYKFHPSMLPRLMTSSRSKSDPLSETCKSALNEIFAEVVYGRINLDKENKYTRKGVECESDSLELLKVTNNITVFKNKKTLENDLLVGTPDVISPELRDVKTSWNFLTYLAVTEDKARKDYYYQMLGYMMLTGKQKAILNYCLVNTPEITMNDELYRLSFKFPEINESEEKAEKYKKQFIFDDIPAVKRVKEYTFEYNQEDADKVVEKLLLCREYLKTITL